VIEFDLGSFICADDAGVLVNWLYGIQKYLRNVSDTSAGMRMT
jgi:hypothetical protein